MGNPGFPTPPPGGRVWKGAALPRRMFIPSVRGGAAWTADMMVFEKFIRYAGLAVGLKPSATGCEARLRGLYRIIFSKTIIEAAHLRACGAAAPLLLTSPCWGEAPDSLPPAGGGLGRGAITLPAET